MKPTLRKYAPAALLAVPALLVACGGSGGTETLVCTLEITPSIVGFGTLCLDAEKEGSFSIRNTGAAVCNVALALGGDASKHFEISPTSVDVLVGSTVEVTAKYHPKGGDAAPAESHGAIVTITSNSEEPPFELKLQGETSANVNQAILSLSCPSVCAGASSAEPCCSVVDQGNEPPYYGRTFLSSFKFGNVEAGRTVTVPLQVTNLGCGELEVTKLDLDARSDEGFCAAASVSVVSPLPTIRGSASAQDRQSATIELQFAPTELCSYWADATIETNDPGIAQNPEFGRFNVGGAGTASVLQIDPSSGSFGDVATGEPATKVFTVWNVGSREIEISSVSVGKSDGVFSIDKIERPNCPAGSDFSPLAAPFSLAYDDHESDCGKDQANVTVQFKPTGAGEFSDNLNIAYGDGVATVRLSGRSNPSIEVIPDDDQEGPVLQFKGPAKLRCGSCTIDGQPNLSCPGACDDDGDCGSGGVCLGGVCAASVFAACTPTCGTGERDVRICNKGHAPLKFDDKADGGGLVVTNQSGGPGPKHSAGAIEDIARDGKDKFSVIPNDCAESTDIGATLAPGACCTATVSYLDARNGGGENAVLRIYTNDPKYPRSANGFAVSLVADIDVDLNPNALFTAYAYDENDSEKRDNPVPGQMVVLDASGSNDPWCEDGSGVGCDNPIFHPIKSYYWELLSISGVGDYAKNFPRTIDGNCPPTINDGVCYEVDGTTAIRGQKIRFFPDRDYPRTYEFRLTVGDGVCASPDSPEHTGTYTYKVEVH